MKEKLTEVLDALCSAIPMAPEFWSAIMGAVVAGVIGYLLQNSALQAARNQRDEDQDRVRKALANGLLFKVIRIHSNLYNIHRHLEDSFSEAENAGLDLEEPWTFVLPLVNPPDPIHFSSEEMGMLLGLKDDLVFNRILPLDAIHNSQIANVKVLNAERRALTERLNHQQAEGNVLSSNLSKDQMLALRPRMLEVNSLILQMRVTLKKDFEDANSVLYALVALLRAKAGVAFKIESKNISAQQDM